MSQVQTKKRVTVASVAREANVSRASVYAVLNATKDINIRVSEKIEKRILEAADKLGYVRDENARTLKTGKTHMIGVLLTGMENQFFDPMLNEMYQIGDERGYGISVFFSSWDLEREKRAISRFCGNRFDGIIWVPACLEVKEFRQNLDLVESMGIPLLLIGSNEFPESPLRGRVGFRERQGIELGLDYLLSLGHRELGVATATSVGGRRGDLHTTRLNYIKEISSRKGISIADERVFTTADNAYGGVALAGEIAALPEERRPTAVFAADDMLARGLIAGLACYGLRVPQDMSVLGVDDSPGNESSAVPLTSVSLQTTEIGRSAVPLLLDMIEGKSLSDAERRILIPTKLMERASCAALERKPE